MAEYQLQREIDGHLLVFDEATSERMAGIRQKDTSAELVVRKVLHELGHRYRVRNRDLPGSPDIANRSQGWAVFVHGCYWHRHESCRRTTTPKRNRNFWQAKFDANVKRDRRVQRELRDRGYRVVVVWECQTADPVELARDMLRALGNPP